MPKNAIMIMYFPDAVNIGAFLHKNVFKLLSNTYKCLKKTVIYRYKLKYNNAHCE